MVRKVNVALIGHRFMGKAHSNAYRQMPRFFESATVPVMKVICGRNEADVKKAAANLGWEEWSTSWEDVLQRKDIDVVDISTPGDLHTPIAIAAAKAGKVVFCEKPLANTLGEAKRVLAAVRKAGVLHMICHNYRKVPAIVSGSKIDCRWQPGRHLSLPRHLFAGLVYGSEISTLLALRQGKNGIRGYRGFRALMSRTWRDFSSVKLRSFRQPWRLSLKSARYWIIRIRRARSRLMMPVQPWSDLPTGLLEASKYPVLPAGERTTIASR